MERLPAGVNISDERLCHLVKTICVPVDRKEGYVVDIPKKGDLSRGDNIINFTELSWSTS